MGVRLIAAALGVLTGLVLVPALSGAQVGGFPPGVDNAGGPPACSLTAGSPWGVQRPSPTAAAEVWIQCNYRVVALTLRSRKAIARVESEPSLLGAQPDDRLGCRREGASGVACDGSIGPFVRTRVSLRLRAAICRRPVLRVQVTASGGFDCSDQPCPAIAFLTSTSGRASGC